MHEIDRYRHLVLPYIKGNVLDLGSGGCPVVPHAIQVELPEAEFAKYNAGNKPLVEPQWRGNAYDLPFKNGKLDTVFSSHLIEDNGFWEPVLLEWIRVLKTGGNLIILVPDKELWNAALRRGQPPNCAHKHEGRVGELTELCSKMGMTTMIDALTNQSPEDYSILYVGKKN